MTESNPGDFARLSSQLREATAAATLAYRENGRLIRLLTMLGSPSAPDEVVTRAVAVLSEAFNADVVCLVSVVGERLLVTTARGLADDDRCFASGWPLSPGAADAVTRRQPVARKIGPDGEDVPPSLAGLGLSSAAFVPMSAASEQSDEILVLYRSSGEPFGGTDLHVLAVVAQRLRILAEDRERAVASERLAESGHLLAPHLDPELLLHTGAELLQRLTISDDAWVVGVAGGMAYRRAHHGTATDNEATTAPRPVEELQAWPSALNGRAWTSTAASWSGSAPRTVMCIPLMRDGAPVALLYATRNSPRPYGVGVLEIATIFASYFGAAMDNADMYHELRRRATLDPLTGLANRDLAVQRLDQSLTTGYGLFTGLLFCDLDGFKSVNDRLGHDAGDELLQQVATRFQKGLRPNDLIARFGGDEFVAVLGEIETLDDVIDVGRRLVKALNEPFDLGEERIAVSASIGGALGTRGETTAAEMLHNADIAMYAAKSRGAGGVEVFDNTTSKRSLH